LRKKYSRSQSRPCAIIVDFPFRLKTTTRDSVPTYRLSDFDYALPPELIAQTPTTERGASRR
jgi:hypothetical protein